MRHSNEVRFPNGKKADVFRPIVSLLALLSLFSEEREKREVKEATNKTYRI